MEIIRFGMKIDWKICDEFQSTSRIILKYLNIFIKQNNKISIMYVVIGDFFVKLHECVLLCLEMRLVVIIMPWHQNDI